MSDLPVFPASKINQIVSQDPDLKSIPKKGIEILRVAAEQFAHLLFQKCSDEAKKKKRTTMNKRDFELAVQNDPALRACLGQFFISPETQKDESKGEDKPEAEEEKSKEDEEPEEEEIHEDLPEEKEPIKEEELEKQTFSTDSNSDEEEEKKSEQPSLSQSEISDLEPDAED